MRSTCTFILAWQRTIMKQLSDHFTNVQFVATTHSPLMVGSMSDVNVAVLRRAEAGGSRCHRQRTKGCRGVAR